MCNSDPGRTRAWLCAGVLLAIVPVLISACQTGSSKSSAAPPPSSTLTFNGKTYASAPVNDFDPQSTSSLPDPVVAGVLQIDAWPVSARVVAAQGWSTGGTGVSILWGNSEAVAMETSYALTGNGPGTGIVETWSDSPAGLCFSSSGTLTVSSLPAVGSYITGDATIAAWTLSGPSGTCPPSPSTVTFSVVRAVDLHPHNNLMGTDQMTVTRTGGDGSLGPVDTPVTLRETSTTPYDPVLAVNNIGVFMSWDASNPDGLNRHLYFWFSSSPPVATGVSIPIDVFGEFVALPTPKSCTASGSGTMIISSDVNPVGGQWTGTFSVPVVTGDSGCPTSYSGSFTITRDP